MKTFFKKLWETVGFGLITVAVVGMVSWWGSYKGTTVTISNLCADVAKLTDSVKNLTTVAGQNALNMVIIKTSLDDAKTARVEMKQEIAEIKKDIKRLDKTMDRHLIGSHDK